MCLRTVWQEPAGDMDSAVFGSILEPIRKAPAPAPVTVLFGGLGEPLLHPRILEMILEAKGAGARTEVTSNGTLLTEPMQNGLLQAGLDRLWVSVDSVSIECAEEAAPGHPVPGIVLSRLRELKDRIKVSGHSLEIAMAFVATQDNLPELPAVLALARDLGVDAVHLSHLIPYHEAQSNETRQPVWYEPGSKNLLPWIGEARLVDGTFIANDTKPEPGCPFIESGAVAVAWDGQVSPCVPLLRTHRTFQEGMPRTATAHVLGQLPETDLLTLWRNRDHTDFRRRVETVAFAPCATCGACNMAYDNAEDCFNHPFPTCGGCPWLQGFVRCP